MKPFNIEIFDRQFNFLYTSLIDQKDFGYNFDAISPVTNTIVITADFKPSILVPGEARAPKGWYIRITRDDEEYQGVITGFEEGKIQSKITYTQLLSLFDFEIWLNSQDIISQSIESYIAQVLSNTFINNDDTGQNINNLTVTYSGSTSGALSYCNTDDVYVSINILSDLLTDAYSTYGIYTNVSADFNTKSIVVNIGISNNAAKIVEGDLPNIISSEFTIKKSQGKEVNKVVIKDSYSGQVTNFYLYDDGTFGTEKNPVGKLRLYPVITKVLVINLFDIAKGYIDDKYNNYIDVLRRYTLKSGTLTNAEYSALQTACNALMPFYANYVGFGTYSFNKIYDEGGLYDFTATSTPRINTTRYDVNYSLEYYEIYGSSNKNISNGNEYDTQYNRYTHTAIYLGIMVDGEYESSPGYIVSGSFGSRDAVVFDESAGTRAFSAYKSTYQYEAEIANYINNPQTFEAVQAKAIAEFARNKYSNNIELTVKEDDSMIKPLDMNIGQVVNIIHEGVSYNSILSGKQIKNGLVTLIFGTIRLELTKILNMKGV